MPPLRKKRSDVRRPGSARLTTTQLAWVDSVIDSVEKAGGPSLRRLDVIHALVDAAAGRPIDPAAIKSLEDLRVAFGALDLRAVELKLRERPRVEGGLLKALEDSIK